jgi:DNA-nicking Smr family endonuclease
VARRRATESEKALWRLAMRDVPRLDGSAAPPPEPVEPPPPAESIPVPPTVPAPAKPSSPMQPGPVDRATLERLRRGQFTVEARIDLHGMDQRQAFTALMGFVDHSARAGRRALLVITGKGPSNQGGGVLRRNVPQWLMASSFSRAILTIVPAHPRHGGEGALYVVLRRRR